MSFNEFIAVKTTVFYYYWYKNNLFLILKSVLKLQVPILINKVCSVKIYSFFKQTVKIGYFIYYNLFHWFLSNRKIPYFIIGYDVILLHIFLFTYFVFQPVMPKSASSGLIELEVLQKNVQKKSLWYNLKNIFFLIIIKFCFKHNVLFQKSSFKKQSVKYIVMQSF